MEAAAALEDIREALHSVLVPVQDEEDEEGEVSRTLKIMDFDELYSTGGYLHQPGIPVLYQLVFFRFTCTFMFNAQAWSARRTRASLLLSILYEATSTVLGACRYPLLTGFIP
jgi:hypothetical protein